MNDIIIVSMGICSLLLLVDGQKPIEMLVFACVWSVLLLVDGRLPIEILMFLKILGGVWLLFHLQGNFAINNQLPNMFPVEIQFEHILKPVFNSSLKPVSKPSESNLNPV